MFEHRELLRVVRGRFALQGTGIHGVPHWLRVRDNGLRLAEVTGARRDVVELFALLHDSRRLNDVHDPLHGERAAGFAQELSGTHFELDADGLGLLLAACRGHSDGLLEGDVTVLTCWDADRLDLGRVGVRPHPTRLCTPAAREPGVLEWAWRRSRR